jgi:hypothetical protein
MTTYYINSADGGNWVIWIIWRFAILIGGLSFVQTGYSVLTDPTCGRVSVGGFRFFTATCNTQGHGFPVLLIGSLSLIIGFAIAFFSVLAGYARWDEFREAKITAEGNAELLENLKKRRARVDSLGCGTIFILVIVLIVVTFTYRELRFHRFNSEMNEVRICGEVFQSETDFNRAFASAESANDATGMITALNKISADLASYSKETKTKLHLVLKSDSDSYTHIVSSLYRNDRNSITIAKSKIQSNGELLMVICSPK